MEWCLNQLEWIKTLRKRHSLAGKKVVVVGGSSGIGLATAEQAKALGAEVVIASRSAEKLKAAADKIGAKGIVADVTNDSSVVDLFRLRSGGPRRGHRRRSSSPARSRPSRWTTCAPPSRASSGELGASRGPPTSVRRLAHHCLRLSQHRPRPNSAIVSAANGALESLTRALALELAPVRVNCVSPGIIDTPIRAAMPEAARKEMLAKTAAGLPVQRVGEAEDIARRSTPSSPTALPAGRSSTSTAAAWWSDATPERIAGLRRFLVKGGRGG